MRIFQKFLWVQGPYLITIERHPNTQGTIHEILTLDSGHPKEALSPREDLSDEDRRAILLHAAEEWEKFWTIDDLKEGPRDWIAWHDEKKVAEVMKS